MRKDIKDGKTTDEDVLELLELLRIKDMQIISTGGRAHRQKWSGLGKWHNMILGGQTPEGRDATNELTYLILEAAKDCQTPHHTLTVRVHERTPEKLMLKALEVVKTGIGMPAFIGDKGHVEFLLARGIPISMARDYILAGCLDINLTGNSLIVSEPMFIVPRVFDIFMHNGVDPKYGKTDWPENRRSDGISILRRPSRGDLRNKWSTSWKDTLSSIIFFMRHSPNFTRCLSHHRSCRTVSRQARIC